MKMTRVVGANENIMMMKSLLIFGVLMLLYLSSSLIMRDSMNIVSMNIIRLKFCSMIFSCRDENVRNIFKKKCAMINIRGGIER